MSMEGREHQLWRLPGWGWGCPGGSRSVRAAKSSWGRSSGPTLGQSLPSASPHITSLGPQAPVLLSFGSSAAGWRPWTRDCTILLSQQGGSRDCPSQEVWWSGRSDSSLVCTGLQEEMSLWLEAPVPDVSPDSAGELWEADTQDASSRTLGDSNCTLREEASMPQSAGGTLGMGLEAVEPTALLPGVEALPETTGEEHWIWRRQGLPGSGRGNLGLFT
ncbi:PREDICTED: uncharacterized protein LOC109390204 [Hipposideros armiger]|uniref:Uncharacterized protein LOC109390204 n=1 Tax=Hipposideros armiger TaxID=186990 RepID=A0A8B7SF18_HIPAR|nr:PREDICTED: uncharacterized protein LOC109390204 [Hipposideros armiger]